MKQLAAAAKKHLRGRMEQGRRNKMLKHITKNQTGLEIGPSLRPCAPKREGYQVEIVDHLSKEELTKKYEAMGLDTSQIEEVDYIWKGQSYTEVTGKTGYYDYVIASHVIEHVPDFVGFLKDCANMLKMDGILSLAVPDKRFTLDHFRMSTTAGKVINDYLSADKNGSTGALTDYCSHVVSRGGETSWSPLRAPFMSKNYRFIHDETFNQKIFQDSIEESAFHDIHQNVFTPSSFELIIYELWQYGLITFKIESIERSASAEFLVSLKKTANRPNLSPKDRMKLIRKVSRENLVR